jgi:hypothetical protein
LPTDITNTFSAEFGIDAGEVNDMLRDYVDLFHEKVTNPLDPDVTRLSKLRVSEGLQYSLKVGTATENIFDILPYTTKSLTAPLMNGSTQLVTGATYSYVLNGFQMKIVISIPTFTPAQAIPANTPLTIDLGTLNTNDFPQYNVTERSLVLDTSLNISYKLYFKIDKINKKIIIFADAELPAGTAVNIDTIASNEPVDINSAFVKQ